MMVFKQGLEENRQLTKLLAKYSARQRLFFDSGLEELFKCLRTSERERLFRGYSKRVFQGSLPHRRLSDPANSLHRHKQTKRIASILSYWTADRSWASNKIAWQVGVSLADPWSLPPGRQHRPPSIPPESWHRLGYRRPRAPASHSSDLQTIKSA